MTQEPASDSGQQAPGETPTRASTPPDVSAPLNFGPTVTIFFSDIRGFTEYTDEHGDAAAFRMLQFHNLMVQEQIALYGGHIVKRLGDSFMVSFDAARNAMACGIGTQKSLAAYNEKVEGAKIHIGIGINTGEPIRDADDFFGGSVNLAARICAAAGASEILVSEAVRHVVGKMEGTEYVDRGYYELKGFHEPQRLFEVDWSGLVAAAAAPPRPRPGAASAAVVATSAPAPAPPARSRNYRLPLIGAGIGLLSLIALTGGFFLLRGRDTGAPSRAPVMTPQAAKPAPAAASPVSASPAPVAQATGSPAPKPAAANPASASPAAVNQAPGSPVTAAAPGGPSPAVAQKPSGSEPPGRLVRADDFSDPARGLFPSNLEGVGRTAGDSGPPPAFQGGYTYQGGALVGRLIGDYPGGDRVVFGRTLLSSEKVTEDFAAEVRGRIASSPNVTRFGVQYALAAGELFTFTIFPGANSYAMTYAQNQQPVTLGTGRTAALRPGSEENLVRIEVRGPTVRFFANGQEIALARHEALGKRGGSVGLNMAVVGPLTDRQAEVQYRDYRQFSLAP